MVEILLQVLLQFKRVRNTRNLPQLLATVIEILVHINHKLQISRSGMAAMKIMNNEKLH